MIAGHESDGLATFAWLKSRYGWDVDNSRGIGMASPVSPKGFQVFEYIDPEGYETRVIVVDLNGWAIQWPHVGCSKCMIHLHDIIDLEPREVYAEAVT